MPGRYNILLVLLPAVIRGTVGQMYALFWSKTKYSKTHLSTHVPPDYPFEKKLFKIQKNIRTIVKLT